MHLPRNPGSFPSFDSDFSPKSIVLVSVKIFLLPTLTPTLNPAFVHAKNAGERGARGTALSCVVELFIPIVEYYLLVVELYFSFTTFLFPLQLHSTI
jgi:hypothetical protein